MQINNKEKKSLSNVKKTRKWLKKIIFAFFSGCVFIIYDELCTQNFSHRKKNQEKRRKKFDEHKFQVGNTQKKIHNVIECFSDVNLLRHKILRNFHPHSFILCVFALHCLTQLSIDKTRKMRNQLFTRM